MIGACRSGHAILAMLALVAPETARSQTVAHGVTQTVPTASSADAPICTDRPTKSNFACTVPRGLIQIEADGLAWLSTTSGGNRTDQLVAANTTVKFGLTSHSDIQLNWTPLVQVRNRDAAGRVDRRAGIGDATLRYKHRLTGATESVQVALLPFIKLPTAPAGIGNGKVEAGVAVPININVPGGWTVTLGPQLDFLADADGQGRHAGVTGLINIARQIGAVTLYNELWTSQNFDPTGTIRQASYDMSLAWLVHPTLQLDIGANIGLNAATPGLVAYLGVAARF